MLNWMLRQKALLRCDLCGHTFFLIITCSNLIIMSVFVVINGKYVQVELGFGNRELHDIFFVTGYEVSGFVVSQVVL